MNLQTNHGNITIELDGASGHTYKNTGRLNLVHIVKSYALRESGWTRLSRPVFL